jgi:hypothetical protein
MTDLFRAFLSGLPTRGGFCLDCLSKLYPAPASTIAGYLSDIGITGRHAVSPSP